MKFAIRDDDVNYFTYPEELNKIYVNIWDKIPVSFSITPFINNRFKILLKASLSGKKQIIEFIKKINKEKKFELNKEFSIEKNKELIKFLQEKYNQKKIDIMLHGYNHNFLENGYEFETDINLEKKVKIGKKLLENLFNTNITVFVPPNNSLSSIGTNAVTKNNLNILIAYGYYIWERPLKTDYIYNFLKIFKLYLIHKRKLSYPYVLKFNDHKEMACYSFNKHTDIKYLYDGFKYAFKKNGNFCLATHYWEINQSKEMLNNFYKFIKYVKNQKNVEFVKASELFTH